jgi:hypothetical protein
MKFDEFWTNLGELLSSKSGFVTIHDKVPFEAKKVNEVIRINSDTITSPRFIQKEEFVRVYRSSLDILESEKFHPGNYSKITLNASYIVTLFDHIMNQK